ncbi:hypothetical protein A9R05_38725 (plasmid) [Burkholderia sp. KK1]|uniref:Membrane protein n=1 Tax=Caballeronia cordobensis TaxID=1353886 RepID=A0A158JFY0_CABCO|nr:MULTISPECIES: DUF485 domain-containing protein [Caballeronia]AET94616.1 hypothetical protein BYI23_D011060 [Burkholderia sp. YI23]AQH04803.1 hypothetical protein A9R05_38725 [Burkholderia sp. KK1]BBQ01473.1 membrane protein [Burkholderia sp. SFA1]MCE4546191.1 DUF485 domain-containing protein [Caballeronia sp. PC1]MCE4573334.1 DUF485 domain-containing protein [Caballeronia sp. CLC5]
MDEQQLEQIRLHPDFRRLVATKTRLAWTLTAVMLTAYFSFVLLLAFSPSTLALRIGAGTVTLGIPVAVAFILLAIALTAVYVLKANGSVDALNESLKEQHA